MEEEYKGTIDSQKAWGLAILVADLEKRKDLCKKANAENPEMSNQNWKDFSKYFKEKARKFNSENNLQIPFCDYLWDCSRDIKSYGEACIN